MIGTTWKRVVGDDIWLAGLLSGTAGFADAIGYSASGVFAANMTGNTVLASMSLAQGHFAVAAERMSTLAAFFAGAMAGSLILRAMRRNAAVPLLVEAGLLVAAMLAEPDASLAILIIAAAMGIQATAVTRFREISISTVVLTSTMARGAEFCLAWLLDREAARSQAAKLAPGIMAACWLSYGLGAAAAIAALAITARPLVVPAVILTIAAAMVFLKNRES